MLCYGCLYIISVSLNYVLFFQFVSCNEEKVFFFCCLIFIPFIYLWWGRGEKKDIHGDSCKKRLIIFLFVFYWGLLWFYWDIIGILFIGLSSVLIIFCFLMIQNKRKGFYWVFLLSNKKNNVFYKKLNLWMYFLINYMFKQNKQKLKIKYE